MLRAYFIHAMRSLTDYLLMVLVELSPSQLQGIQVQQHKTLRLIVGASGWSKVSNLQAETNIAPVEVRITKNVAAMASKLLTSPGYTVTRARLRPAIAKGDQFNNVRCGRKVSNSLTASGLSYDATHGDDTPCKNYLCFI